MKRYHRFSVFVLIVCLMLPFCRASSEFLFADARFRGKLTTENLDAIIDEYELFDGWYWTTPANVLQDFHGHPDSPGWTSESPAQLDLFLQHGTVRAAPGRRYCTG